jgi:hypothetical protein
MFDVMQLDMTKRNMLDSDQEARRKGARRTAMVVAAVAIGIFVFSILQMVWLQHGGAAH